MSSRQIAWFDGQAASLPGSYAYREFVDAGGLMSYGVSNDGLRQAVVEYADKVLRGKPPGDLPMEQPIRYEFVINLKTASALGLRSRRRGSGGRIT